MTAAPIKKVERFAKDETVLGFHGPCLYQAKILEVEETDTKAGNEAVKYYVHYFKWAKRWDEWVGAERLLKFTKENQAYAKELLKNAPKAGAAAAAAAPAADDEDDTAGGKKGKRKAADDKGGKKKKAKLEEVDDVGEDETLDKKEVKLKLPGPLKKQLFEDWKRVTKEGKLVPLPRDMTVTKLLEEFVKSKKTKGQLQENLCKEVVEGCRQYFERSLGKLLLYRFERLQYASLSEKPETKGKNVCDIYGAEHLLRLFVKLPALLSHTSLSPKEATVLAAKLTDVISFLKRKQAAYFVSEYVKADDEYVKQSGPAAASAEAANPAPAAAPAAASPAPASAAASAAK